MPISVTSRLGHRASSLPVQKLGCEDAKSARARSFAEAQRTLYRIKALHDTELRPALDACAAQPLTEIGAATIQIGAGAIASNEAPAFVRSYALGLGLTHALQERIEDARGPLMLARESARTPKERAMAEAVLAQLAAPQ